MLRRSGMILTENSTVTNMEELLQFFKTYQHLMTLKMEKIINTFLEIEFKK